MAASDFDVAVAVAASVTAAAVDAVVDAVDCYDGGDAGPGTLRHNCIDRAVCVVVTWMHTVDTTTAYRLAMTCLRVSRNAHRTFCCCSVRDVRGVVRTVADANAVVAAYHADVAHADALVNERVTKTPMHASPYCATSAVPEMRLTRWR